MTKKNKAQQQESKPNGFIIGGLVAGVIIAAGLFVTSLDKSNALMAEPEPAPVVQVEEAKADAPTAK